MSLLGFEIAISESERPQIDALDRAATGIGWDEYIKKIYLGGKTEIS
jgi:hypothetical protein